MRDQCVLRACVPNTSRPYCLGLIVVIIFFVNALITSMILSRKTKVREASAAEPEKNLQHITEQHEHYEYFFTICQTYLFRFCITWDVQLEASRELFH